MSHYRHPDPLFDWMDKNQPTPAVDLEIDRWLASSYAAAHAMVLEGYLENWLNGDPEYANLAEPVEIIALYGKSFGITRNWKKLPVQISEDELPAWREHNYATNIHELREYQLSAVGGFLKQAGRDPQAVVAFMQQQLEAKLSEMEALAHQPVENYMPKDFDDEEIYDGDQIAESHVFNRVFDLRDEMEYFRLGLQHMRMYVMTEHNDDLGLPNRPLFDALTAINLNRLIARTEAVDPSLKKILDYLARHQEKLATDKEEAPDGIWWRHWKDQQKDQDRGSDNRETKSDRPRKA